MRERDCSKVRIFDMHLSVFFVTFLGDIFEKHVVPH
jgi:hypothetical protein